MGGLDLRMLQSQKLDMVRPFNTSPFYTSQPLREVYYLLYADGYEIPSKVANDPEEPSIGRIRADSITPPHSPTSIKLCISRVEKNQNLLTPIFSQTHHAILH